MQATGQADVSHIRTFLEQFPEGVILLEASRPEAYDTIIDCNDMLARMNGYTREELIGQNIEILNVYNVESGKSVGARRSYIEMLRREGRVQYETTHRRKDGSHFRLEVVTCLVNLDGHEYILGIDRDISNRKNTFDRFERPLFDALHDTVRVLNTSLKLDEVLRRILNEVKRVVPHDTSSVTLIEGETAYIVQCNGFAEHGLENEVLNLRFHMPDLPHFVHMLVTHQPTIIQDTWSEPGWLQVLGEGWVRSSIAAPILLGDDVIGFLHLDSARPGAFTPSQAVQLQTFADQTAIAIRNAQLYSELDRLYRATSFLFTPFPSTHLNELGRQVACAVTAEYQNVNCGVIVLDGTRLCHLPRAGHYSLNVLPVLELDGPGLVAEALRTRTIVYAHNVKHDSRYLGKEERTVSELVIPLMAGDKVVGALDLQSTEYNAFSPNDQRVLMAFGERAALAIENMRYAGDLENRVSQRTEELQRANQEIRAILQSTSDAIIVAENDGAIRMANPAAEQMFLRSEAELCGRPAFVLASPHDHNLLRSAFEAATESRHSRRVEVLAQRRDGSQFEADVAVAPIVEGEAVLGVICSLRDISETKHMERELRKALEQERELNALKSRFVSAASHEFRTPLATIMMATELIKNYASRMTPQQQNEKLDRIQEQIYWLTQLLDDLLIINKVDTGKLQFHPARMDVEVFCRRMVDEARVQDHNSHIFEVLASGQDRQISGDETLLGYSLRNLLSNAAKFSPVGSTIRLEVRCSAEQTVIQVRDTGIGISPEDQASLFNVFHRGANAAHIPGTGLGLTIAKQCIDMHSGQITIESTIGVGSTFTITLPKVMTEGKGT
jgi:PAS domain S-box-containing protein